jgi:hypothetical protein
MMKVSEFIVRHFIASIVSVLLPVGLAVVAYVVLFILAIITNSDPGGPLSLPFGIVLTGTAAVLYTALLLFPAVAMADFISRHLRGWRQMMGLPIALLNLLVLIFAAASIIRLYPGYENTFGLMLADDPAAVVLVLTLPLAVYWWTTKIVQFGLWIPTALFRKLKKPAAS